MDWVSEGFELLNILHLGYRETNASTRCTGQVVLRLAIDSFMSSVS